MSLDAEQLEARLMSHGVYVTSLDADEDRIAVEYESVTAGQAGAVPHREVGRVINVVRELTETPREVRGTVTDLDGERVGDWYAEADWLRELDADDLSEVEFSEKVVGTIDDA